MTAIGSYASNQFVLRNNLDAQARTQDLRIQLATGKQAQQYGGIAGDTRRLEGLETEYAANDAFTKNIRRTELRLDTMEGTVSGLQDIAEEFRTTLLSAANGENRNSLDLGGIAEKLREEAVALMNTDVEGRYLFSGSATNTAPITLTDGGTPISAAQMEAGQLYYQGNDQTLSVRADEGVTLDYGVSASPSEDAGFQELLTGLTRVIEQPNDQAAIDDAIDDLTGAPGEPGAIAKLADTRAQIGSSLDVLGGIRTRIEDSQVAVEGDISDTENVDMTRAVTLLSEQQQILETSLAVTSRLSRTSLLNYL